MTKHEAVEILEEVKTLDDSMFAYSQAYNDALEMAIEALKAQEQQATTPDAEWLLFRGRKGATCSYCKRTFYDVYDVENYDYYCRHCGARMVKIRTVKWE